MTHKTLYFAARKTIRDNSNWGDNISQHQLLTIYGITKKKVAQITEDSNHGEIDNRIILEYFIAQNPGFRRRKEKILYLITDYQLVLKLLGSLGFSTTEYEDGGNTTQIDYDFDEISINDTTDSTDPSAFEGVKELCEQLGIKAIENIPESILRRIENLEPLFKGNEDYPDFSKLLED